MRLLICLCLFLSSQVFAQLPKLKVSENNRFLQTEDGKPFFWTGDTAWELIHKLDYDEVDHYFKTRAEQGFNIVQTVYLAELDGIDSPNALGQKPFVSVNPMKLNVSYINHVRTVLDKAAENGLYVALLPTWGDKLFKNSWGTGPEIFNEKNAFEYGKLLGLHLRDKTNIVWIIGGDRNPREGTNDAKVWQEMAKGIKEGLGIFVDGIFSFHPQPHEPGGSSRWFHNDDWLSFNMHQTGHCPSQTYKKIAHDYNLQPVKPTIDGEPLYEDHPNCFNAKELGYSLPRDIRRIMYWNVFAGAFGQTYGSHNVWQMHVLNEKGVNGPLRPWKKSLDLPMANQVKHLKSLMLSRPYFDRIPDQGLIEGEQSDDENYTIGTRDESGTYAFIYCPTGKTVNINTKNLRGQNLRIWWYDVRTGAAFMLGNTVNYGSFAAVPPSSGKGNDWVLVIDDASKGYDKPGTVAY
ncbi:glycoside hydrolase family 140 protein [uncultured Arcticibacterium sp.]|uniref:glycoside hydrolase family 140 protein n=1 Tax=uncultured Arcticibacterium sp. TaxID=2173042 RepID=UPI0030F54BF0